MDFGPLPFPLCEQLDTAHGLLVIILFSLVICLTLLIAYFRSHVLFLFLVF